MNKSIKTASKKTAAMNKLTKLYIKDTKISDTQFFMQLFFAFVAYRQNIIGNYVQFLSRIIA